MTAPSLTTTLLVPLVLVPLATAVTYVALRIPRFVEARRNRRAAERTRSLRELLSLLPLHQAVQRELRRGQALLDPLHDTVERRREARERAQRAFTRHGHVVIESPDHVIAWIVLFGGVTILWVVLVVQHWQLETQIINTLTSDPGSTDLSASSLAYSLATVAVAITVGLGLLLAERIRPSGAIPRWKARSGKERAPLAIGMAVFLGCVIVAYALIAPIRADDIHGPTVDSTRTACDVARADLATAPPDSLDQPELQAAEQMSCAEADRAANRHQAARTWDAMITILASLGEAIFGAFALHFAMLVAAGLLRARVAVIDCRVRRAESRLRRRSVRFQDRIVDVVTAHPDVDPDEADAYISSYLDGGQRPPPDVVVVADDPNPIDQRRAAEEEDVDQGVEGFVPLGDLAADRPGGPRNPPDPEDDADGPAAPRGPWRPTDLPDAV